MREITPSQDAPNQTSPAAGPSDARPREGFSPNRPQHAAGMRIDPPPSLGYGLYHQVKALGHDCLVVAPTLIPKRSGERIRRTGATRSPWRACIGPAS